MSGSKRKLIISMLVAMFIILSVVAVVTIAFAAQQQNISTTLNITYTAQDLDGTVSATYQIGASGTKTDLIPNADDDHKSGTNLVFKASDSGNAGSLEFPETENFSGLSTTNNYVLIEYTYTNTGAKTYAAGVTFNPDEDQAVDNMEISYSLDGSNWKTSDEDYYGIIVQGLSDTVTTSTKVYYVKIQIKNVAQNANLVGAFNWQLKGYDKEIGEGYETMANLGFTVNAAGVCQVSVANVEDTDKIVFPSEILGNTVATISQNTTLTPEQKSKISSVEIPDSVTTIEDGAFNGYTNLRDVTFKQNGVRVASVKGGLTSIGNQAFYGCTSLSSIELPNSVKNVSSLAFYGCTSLTSVSGNIVSVSSNAFNGCSSLREFPFENVTSIGASAFAGCSRLTSVELPEGFTGLTNGNEFENCTILSRVKFPSTVTKVDARSFAGCSNLNTIEVDSANTEYISLCNCLIEKKTKTLVLGNADCSIPSDGSVTKIAAYAFSGRDIQDVTIPERVTSIDARAFENCAYLTSVTFSNPDGWTASNAAGEQTVQLSNLSDAEEAANLLKTYASQTLYSLTRSEN